MYTNLNYEDKAKNLITNLLKAQEDGRVSSSCAYKHHIHTPFDLCEEICNKLPRKYGSKYLVLFNLEFVYTLREILDFEVGEVYYYTTDTNKAKLAEKLFPGVQILKGLDVNMKFDVVVGNPPYQSTEDGSKRKKMWVQFTEKCIDISNYVAFVTPTVWQKNNSKYFKKVGEQIKSKLVDHGPANDYFPNIGEDIGFWIVDKNTHSPIQLVDNNPCSPIYKKMLRKGERWHYRDFQQPHSDIDKVVFPSTPTNDFNIPIYWTAKQVRYCRLKDVKYSGWKVIINNSGHYYMESDPDKYSRVDNSMTVGLGAWGIKVASETEGKNVLSWVRSKLYRVVVQNMKTGGFNNPFVELENLGSSKIWTDQELYEHFGLTQEEINYIEEAVK